MQLMQEGFNSNVEETKTTDLEEPITPAGTEGGGGGGGERINVGEEKNEASADDVVAGDVPRDEPQEDKVGENMKKTGAAAEDKAARIQRLKSGFRICKPQGTFLWPDMAVSSSPSPQFAVEDLLVVPTPTAVPYSPTSHRDHHHQTSDGEVLAAPPSSPVKPLAEKRTVSLAAATNETAQTHCATMKATGQIPSISHHASPVTEETLMTIRSGASSPIEHVPSEGSDATLIINLNELPKSTIGAPSLTYKRRYQNTHTAAIPNVWHLLSFQYCLVYRLQLGWF